MDVTAKNIDQLILENNRYELKTNNKNQVQRISLKDLDREFEFEYGICMGVYVYGTRK